MAYHGLFDDYDCFRGDFDALGSLSVILAIIAIFWCDFDVF